MYVLIVVENLKIMNSAQLATIYENFSETQRDMTREQFISKALATEDFTKNKNILNAMVERKHQIQKGKIEQARIDVALRVGR